VYVSSLVPSVALKALHYNHYSSFSLSQIVRLISLAVVLVVCQLLRITQPITLRHSPLIGRHVLINCTILDCMLLEWWPCKIVGKHITFCSSPLRHLVTMIPASFSSLKKNFSPPHALYGWPPTDQLWQRQLDLQSN
jgi:hypothetical protein